VTSLGYVETFSKNEVPQFIPVGPKGASAIAGFSGNGFMYGPFATLWH